MIKMINDFVTDSLLVVCEIRIPHTFSIFFRPFVIVVAVRLFFYVFMHEYKAANELMRCVKVLRK